MKNSILLVAALVSVVSIQAMAYDRYDHEGYGHSYKEHYGDVTVHVHRHHETIHLRGDDWRVRISTRRAYRFRDGVMFDEYMNDWHVGYWRDSEFTMRDGYYFYCADQGDYAIEPSVVDEILAQYPGIDYNSIRIVPTDEGEGYNAVIFVALPDGEVVYVMDYNVNF